MSKGSESVKLWRKNTKKRMIQSMGSCCQICSYNKCDNALEFHHLNPKEKEMGLGAIRGNIVGWNKIIIELKKCILLCANCHREVHEGVSFIPESFCVFDESFADYKELKPKKQKIKKGRFYKVKWEDVDLLELKKQYTNVQIASSLGVSETAVRKRLKVINA